MSGWYKVCGCKRGILSRHDGKCGHCRTIKDDAKLRRFFDDWEFRGCAEGSYEHLLLRLEYFGQRKHFKEWTD